MPTQSGSGGQKKTHIPTMYKRFVVHPCDASSRRLQLDGLTKAKNFAITTTYLTIEKPLIISAVVPGAKPISTQVIQDWYI